MSCLKNRVLKLITLINGISFLYFGSLLDSYSWIPGIICCINFAWLALFAYANGYTYKSEKGEEMGEIKEQKKTASIITEIATTASIQKFETELMKKGE